MLSDKIILITGAAQGIGEAAGRVFAGQGATVVLTDIASERVAANAEAIAGTGGSAVALAMDVTRSDMVDAAVAEIVGRFGRIDGLFHNAMSAAYVNNNDTVVTELSDEVWNTIVGLTLTGSFHVMRAVGRAMLKRKQGSMVFTATVDALIGQAGIDAYTAAKGGVVALVRSAAAGLSPEGVRINSLCPGFVSTPDQAKFLDDPVQRAALDRLHLMEIAAPEDIAEFAAFLLSDKARRVTGANHIVDSGYSAFKGDLDLRQQISSD